MLINVNKNVIHKPYQFYIFTSSKRKINRNQTTKNLKCAYEKVLQVFNDCCYHLL